MNNWNLFIARHWETESNKTGAIVGITDVWLTDKWIQDAHLVWSNLNQNIDLIITSPQNRALQTSEILRKYTDTPIVEHPLLHPQNFWVIEWLTLDEARQKGLWQYLHSSDTNKYLHKAKWWESAQEMESRTIPEIYKLLELAKQKSMNILLMSHNSITRCLVWNANNITPDQWVNHNVWNNELLHLKRDWINSDIFTWSHWWITNLLWEEFSDINFTKEYWSDFLSKFAELSLNEEIKVLNYLLHNFPSMNNVFLNSLVKLLENTIALNKLFLQVKKESNVPWIYSVLQFWSSIYWKNYSVKDHTDLDIEIIIDEDFDVNMIKDTVLWWYKYGDIVEDFWDFLKSWADYFSFKAYYNWRLVDFRITHKSCFDKICKNSLEEWDEYIMQEFRKQFRENGIVPWRKNFNWTEFAWENDINYSNEWQTIYYPLFTYENGHFVAGNNLDKYCSFTDGYKNEIEVKKKLFELRKKFNTIFLEQKNQELIGQDANISDIFVRKARFPQFLINDLEYRYKVYNILFTS